MKRSRTRGWEILGYEHIVSLATSGGYADAVRSIEYAAMAGFFNPKAELDPELCAYFAGFQQIISYLYDPDGFFAGNLRRCGVKNLIEASPKVDIEGDHATRQLARPLERLALYLDGEAAVRLRPAKKHQEAAEATLRTLGGGWQPGAPLVAIHPGSGGERKNWPPDRWEALGRWLFNLPDAVRPWVLLVGGESDGAPLAALQKRGKRRFQDPAVCSSRPTNRCPNWRRCWHGAGFSSVTTAASRIWRLPSGCRACCFSGRLTPTSGPRRSRR